MKATFKLNARVVKQAHDTEVWLTSNSGDAAEVNTLLHLPPESAESGLYDAQIILTPVSAPATKETAKG